MIGSWWIRVSRGFARLISGQSLQWRLAALTGLSVAVSVILVGGATFLVARASLFGQLDQELLSVAQATSASVKLERADLGDLSLDSPGSPNGLMALVSADGSAQQMPTQQMNLPVSAEEVAIARVGVGSSGRSVEIGDVLYRVVSVPVAVGEDHYALAFARPMTSLQSTLDSLWWVVISAGLIGTLTTTGTALWAAQAVLAPVRRLSSAVKSVTQTNQLNPIRIYGRDDLGELTKSFNTMLRSLQQSREQQRQLIADAGHELRTPLTSMRTNIELLVADDKTGMLPEGARSEVLGDVAAQLGEFSALVGDLVALTRDDHLQRPHELLDLADVAEAAIARAQRRGPGIVFDVRLEPTPIMGDASTLERAITNLLDNAVKFTPAEGVITVTLRDAALTIVDSGPGIDDEDLPLIFDRFYRSDKARNTPGTGLGLSIVAHTVEAHGGTVKASNAAEGGAKFTMTIPPANLTPVEEPAAP